MSEPSVWVIEVYLPAGECWEVVAGHGGTFRLDKEGAQYLADYMNKNSTQKYRAAEYVRRSNEP